MKPQKIEVFTCGICGATYTTEGPAKNCIRSHLDPRELIIKHEVLKIPGSTYSHETHDRFPAIISVYANNTDNPALYARIDSLTDVKNKRQRKPGAPMWGR